MSACGWRWSAPGMNVLSKSEVISFEFDVVGEVGDWCEYDGEEADVRSYVGIFVSRKIWAVEYGITCDMHVSDAEILGTVEIWGPEI